MMTTADSTTPKYNWKHKLQVKLRFFFLTFIDRFIMNVKFPSHYHLQAPPPLQPEYHKPGNRGWHRSTAAWRIRQTSRWKHKQVRFEVQNPSETHNNISVGSYLFTEFHPLWSGGRRSKGIGPIAGKNLSSFCTRQTLRLGRRKKNMLNLKFQHFLDCDFEMSASQETPGFIMTLYQLANSLKCISV